MSDKLGKMVTNVIEVEKNGVKVVIKQQYNKEINDINIEFSEHDKVFEDKIAELKKDYKTASELLGKYQQENEALKKRIKKLDTIDAMRIDEKRELKQRIAELESKETEKQKKRTGVIVAKEIDGQTYVTLDDFMSFVNDLQAEIGT